jgi:membrane-bound lytic murein transglycosylase MltF
MRRLWMHVGGVAVLALLALCAPVAGESQVPPAMGPSIVAAVRKPWTGDLDGMIKRRMVRVLVVNSKTFYFVDKGTQRGVTYDIFKTFEDTLNRKLKSRNIRVHVLFIPVARDELLPDLIQGRGDIAAASLTITPERQKLVDFARPVWSDVSEIVVTGPQSPEIKTMDDLAGKDVFVRKSSSYYESLLALNARLHAEGKPPVHLTAAPEVLEDEDLLEMVNAGLIGVIVVDRPIAELWKQIFPDIVLHPTVALRTGGEIAWAIRKGSPKLRAELDAFGAAHKRGTAFGNEVFRRYLKSVKYVKHAASEAEVQKLRALRSYFQAYGNEYRLDWILMAAQGYQESRLDQSVKSPVGAIGVMQVMPTTGKHLQVGNIQQAEPNVHAGVKYIRFMVDRYYKDAPMDDLNKTLFAFASYNAGPARIAQLRKEAAKRGLDPNRWFNNVELVASEKIGRETVTYVSNIFKYYVAYTLLEQERAARAEAKAELKATAPGKP